VDSVTTVNVTDVTVLTKYSAADSCIELTKFAII